MKSVQSVIIGLLIPSSAVLSSPTRHLRPQSKTDSPVIRGTCEIMSSAPVKDPIQQKQTSKNPKGYIKLALCLLPLRISI